MRSGGHGANVLVGPFWWIRGEKTSASPHSKLYHRICQLTRRSSAVYNLLPRGRADLSPTVEARRGEDQKKTEEFDEAFDRGEDVTAHLDLSKARRLDEEQRRVNVDFPAWMIKSLDREASRLGVPRQSIIKVWIAERLEQLRAHS